MTETQSLVSTGLGASNFATETPHDRAVEVIVYRNGTEFCRETCDNAQDAAIVAAEWTEHVGVHCEVVDQVRSELDGATTRPV